MNFISLVFYKSFAKLISENQSTYLKFFWWFVEPLSMMLVYYVVFGVLLNFRTEDFIFYLLVGLVFWQWFSKTVSNSSLTINNSGKIISTVSVSKLLFPSVEILTEFFKSFIVVIVLLVVLNLAGYITNINYIYLPLILMAQFSFIVAVSFWVSLLLPFFPDLRVLLNLLLSGMMFASGIFYDLALIPERYLDYFLLNPMAFFIDCHRKVLLYASPIETDFLLSVLFYSVLATVAAVAFERKYNNLYVKILLR